MQVNHSIIKIIQKHALFYVPKCFFQDQVQSMLIFNDFEDELKNLDLEKEDYQVGDETMKISFKKVFQTFK